MDCTSICRMLQRSTVIRSDDNNGDGDGNGSTRITMQKRVKNIRLTHGQLKQQSRCKTRLVLLLLGLWMNLIAVTNGKWKIQLVKHMFCSPFFSLQLFVNPTKTLSISFELISSNLISFHITLNSSFEWRYNFVWAWMTIIRNGLIAPCSSVFFH